MYLLMKQVIFTLQCLCTIWLNIIILIQTHLEVYGRLKEMKFHLIIIIWLLISLSHSNTKHLLLEKQNVVNNTNSSVKNTKIVISSNYLSNFCRSLKMSLINSKTHLELKWIEDCILGSAGNSAKFKITDAKIHVPIVYLLKIV